MNYTSKWLGNEAFVPIQVLKQAYQAEPLRNLNEKDNKIFLAQILIKDIAMKGFSKERFPDTEVQNDIKKMILKRYNTLSPIEIELALQMDRYGELTDKNGDKIKHFQFYGTEYIAEILQAYLRWKTKTAMEHNLSRKQKSIEIIPDYEKIDAEYVNSIIDDLKRGKYFRDTNAYLLYDKMFDKIKLPKDEMMKIFDAEKEFQENEHSRKKLKQAEDSLDTIKLKKLEETFRKSFKQILQERCRSIVVCRYLCKENNIDHHELSTHQS